MTSTGRGRPTLEEVALRAGVSRATASRVVNGSPKVAPEIQDAVRRAISELGYVPNTAARSLVTQRTGLYALVVPEPASRVFSDDLFFPGLIQGVSEELEAVDRQLALTLVSSPTSYARIEQYALGRHVDGVMIASMHGADPLPETLHRLGVPVVANGRPMRPGKFPYVDIDHAGGVETAIRYLVRSGRARIATIAGPQDMVAGVDRLSAYRSALTGSKRRSLVAVGDFTRESGAEAMRLLLADDPHLDAVFVASDLMADGALRTLRQAGRRIPDDVAVIGFDDVEIARYTEPTLTTVRQPINELGRRLARQVVRLCGGEDVEPSLVLPTKLIIRASA